MSTADILNFTTSFITLRPGITVCVLTPESVAERSEWNTGEVRRQDMQGGQGGAREEA
jgi:hypothetical protein